MEPRAHQRADTRHNTPSRSASPAGKLPIVRKRLGDARADRRIHSRRETDQQRNPGASSSEGGGEDIRDLATKFYSLERLAGSIAKAFDEPI